MKHHHILLAGFISLFVACSGCSKKTTTPVTTGYDWARHTPFTTSYQTFLMPYTDAYVALPAENGTVEMSEASGIAMSVKNAGMIWGHNDSGHPNTIFLINATTGRIVARYQVAGTVNQDWEDMEVRVDPANGKPYIYVGDIGDNDQKRPDRTIYRFEEPLFLPAHEGRLLIVDTIPVERFRFQYPDGKHDTESLMVDPVTKDIFLVTKSGVASTIYVLPYPQSADGLNMAVKAGAFSFRQASAATISPDGSRIMVRNRQELFYWEIQPGETLVQTLQRTPVKAPYAGEPQGEAVCFDADNNYYTLSEQAGRPALPILYKYSKKQ